MTWAEFLGCIVVNDVKDMSGEKVGRYTAACPVCGIEIAITGAGVVGFGSPLACAKAVAQHCRSAHQWVIDDDDEVSWDIRQPV